MANIRINPYEKYVTFRCDNEFAAVDACRVFVGMDYQVTITPYDDYPWGTKYYITVYDDTKEES